MHIKTGFYQKEGMLIHFKDGGDFLDLTVENIKKLADEYWNNPEKLPPEEARKRHRNQRDRHKEDDFRGQCQETFAPRLGVSRWIAFNVLNAIIVPKKTIYL